MAAVDEDTQARCGDGEESLKESGGEDRGGVWGGRIEFVRNEKVGTIWREEAVTGKEDHGGGVRVGGGLRGEPGEGVYDLGGGSTLVVEQADMVAVVGVGAEVWVGECVKESLGITGGGRQGPLREECFPDADEKGVAVVKGIWHLISPISCCLVGVLL